MNEGILYTEYPRRTDLGPLLISSWSFESIELSAGYTPFEQLADGRSQVRIERTNPLLKVMLPEAGVGVIVNVADRCRIGAMHGRLGAVPRCFVVGPLTQPARVRLGNTVRAFGFIVDAVLAEVVFGAKAASLVNRITPLSRYWGSRVSTFISDATDLPTADVARRLQGLIPTPAANANKEVLHQAATIIRASHGTILIGELADRLGVTRQHITRLFREATGFPPKEYARLVRFGNLLRSTLLRGPDAWIDMVSDLKLADQAHLIREFKNFTGEPPRTFLRA